MKDDGNSGRVPSCISDSCRKSGKGLNSRESLRLVGLNTSFFPPYIQLACMSSKLSVLGTFSFLILEKDLEMKIPTPPPLLSPLETCRNVCVSGVISLILALS